MTIRHRQKIFAARSILAASLAAALWQPTLAWAEDAYSYSPPAPVVVAQATESAAPSDVPMPPPLMGGGDAGQMLPEESALVAAPPAKPKPDPKKLQAAVAGAYKGVFYDNNFDYLCNPAYNDYHLGEGLKRICIHDGAAILDLGGEYRTRYQHENHFRGLGLTGVDDDFLLHRTRLYTNLEIGDRFRFYGEYLDAESNYENNAPRAIEVNRSDVLNFFGDYVLLDTDCGTLTGRVGRQELLYGDQRLISPLDWANTRRTFDGAKLMWAQDDWKVDGFWTKPVQVDRHNLDTPDDDQQFYAAYATYSGIKDHVFDYYWIGYQSDRALFPGTQPFHYQTPGARWAANWDCWLTIVEGAYQFGEYGPLDHTAGFVTLGAGHKWNDHCWKPEVWGYYDWASGGDTVGNGFNQLFPLGHKYLGFMDLYARSNIQDINFTFATQPSPKLKTLLWWHVFFLENTNDVPYTVNGRPFVATAGGDPYLGQEVDLLFTYAITPRAEVLLGYSHFFTGDWYRTNPAAPFSGDADFFYGQFSQKF